MYMIIYYNKYNNNYYMPIVVIKHYAREPVAHMCVVTLREDYYHLYSRFIYS